MRKFTKTIVATFLLVALSVVLAIGGRTYLQVYFPGNSAGTGTDDRFWRSGTTTGANMVSTVALANKDTLVRAGILYSRVFDLKRTTEKNPSTGNPVQIPPDLLWFGGTYVVSGQVQDSLMLTWYGHRADGDSTTTAVAAQDTIVIDTVGVSDFADQVLFMNSFTPAIIYDKMSVTIQHVRQVSGDTAYFDDCFLRAQWTD